MTVPELPVALDDPIVREHRLLLELILTPEQMKASSELPSVFPYNRDMNSGGTLGLGKASLPR